MYKAIVFPNGAAPIEKDGFSSIIEAFVWSVKEHDYEDDVFVILENGIVRMGGIFDGAEETWFPDTDLNEYFRRFCYE